jgi:hypothetical protein
LPLQVPYYNLEETLDLTLKQPFEYLQNIKVKLVATVENDTIEDFNVLNKIWLEQIAIDESDYPKMTEELFYIAELRKKFTIDTNTIEIGEHLLIPESYIDRNLTTPSQKEPSTIVFDFDFDYNNTNFKDIDHIIQTIQDLLLESEITAEGRQAKLYEEEDVEDIFALLKIYYKIERNEYNLNSIKNILCSAATRQVVLSSSTNKRIEIFIDPIIRNKVICTLYNKRNREIREFYF